MSKKAVSKEKIIEKVDLAKLLKDDTQKGFFRSHGVSEIKVTRLEKDENGEPVNKEFHYLIDIYPVGDHPVLKEFNKKFPEPKPTKRLNRLIHRKSGVDWTAVYGNIDEALNDPDFVWASTYDYTDPAYLKAVDERTGKIRVLILMICFDMVDEYGIDKIDEFEERLKAIGLTANQLNKLGDDINALDFLPGKKPRQTPKNG